jgi:hypothetical protein
LKQHSTQIRARKVEVEVKGISCAKKRGRFRYRKVCRKRCAECVKEAIEVLVKVLVFKL